MAANQSVVNDVLIVGGGHAGLSAALTTYRSQLKTVIFDSDAPRNEWNTTVRLTPTWDGASLADLRKASRDELAKSEFVSFVDSAVQSISKAADGVLFEAVDATGKTWLGRKVLLAIGSSSIFPNIPGYDECFTQSIYPCMFQFGLEQRGVSSAGLLAVDALSRVPQACMLADDGHRFTDNFTIYTDGNETLTSELEVTVKDRGMAVDGRKIQRLRSHGKQGEGLTIEFADGTSKTEGFLVHRQLTRCTSPLVEQLGLELSPMGDIQTSMPFCHTNVPGVFAAGDCATMMKIIPQAVAMGAYAGCGLARELPRRVTGNPCT